MEKWFKGNTKTNTTSSISNKIKNKILPTTSTNNKKRRKYDLKYIQFGFVVSCVDNEERPMCVICLNTHSNYSMRPGKLSIHLITKHPEYQNKTSDLFQRKASELHQQTVFFYNHFHLNYTFLKASFEIDLLNAKANKSFTINNLVLPGVIQMCEILHGDKISEALRYIPVSNDTIKKIITYMGDHIKS